MKKTVLIPGLLVLCLIQSCNEVERCTETDLVSRTGVRFKVRGGRGERDTTLNQVSFYSLLKPDSLILEFVPSIRTFSFPLPADNGEMNSFILVAGQKYDTLHIAHEPKLELVSFQCGFTSAHTIRSLSFGNSLIDTVVINNSYVSMENDENLWIYINPAVADTARQ